MAAGLKSQRGFSKVLKIFPGLYEENVAQSSVGAGRWAVARSVIALGSVIQGLAASGQPLLFQGVVLFPLWDALPLGSFATGKR